MIGPTFYIKRSDILPVLKTVLTDAAGNPVDLTGASALFIMRGPWETSPKISEPAEILDQTITLGGIAYEWTGTNTDTAGSYRGEFQVTFPGAQPQTFPTNGYISIEIGTDLNTGTADPIGEYCSPNDLLLGDLQIPATLDPALYVRRASRDVDIALSQRFEVPITSDDPITVAILKSVTSDLASAYLLMAQAQGGEDNAVNAYGMHLYNRAWDRLMPYRVGEMLTGATLVGGSTTTGDISITQQDSASILGAYETFVTTPDPLGWGWNDGGGAYNFYGEDGPR